MIATLRGRVTHVLADGAVIEVGGVGYRVHLTTRALATLPRHGDVLVHTHTYVREDTLALYAFPTAAEHHAFELLLGATGVGPKLALAILGTFTPDALWAAVRAGDADALVRVPGVGRKGAQRLLLELRSRAGEADALPPAGDGAAPTFTEAREALAALGYGPAEIKDALDALPADAAATASTADLVKLALRALGRTVRG